MQNTHVTVDGGEQWLSWAYSRARAMRSLGLPYMTKRYEMGDGSSVVVRLAQEMTYIELKQVKGGYGVVVTGGYYDPLEFSILSDIRDRKADPPAPPYTRKDNKYKATNVTYWVGGNNRSKPKVSHVNIDAGEFVVDAGSMRRWDSPGSGTLVKVAWITDSSLWVYITVALDAKAYNVYSDDLVLGGMKLIATLPVGANGVIPNDDFGIVDVSTDGKKIVFIWTEADPVLNFRVKRLAREYQIISLPDATPLFSTTPTDKDVTDRTVSDSRDDAGFGTVIKEAHAWFGYSWDGVFRYATVKSTETFNRAEVGPELPIDPDTLLVLPGTYPNPGGSITTKLELIVGGSPIRTASGASSASGTFTTEWYTIFEDPINGDVIGSWGPSATYVSSANATGFKLLFFDPRSGAYAVVDTSNSRTVTGGSTAESPYVGATGTINTNTTIGAEKVELVFGATTKSWELRPSFTTNVTAVWPGPLHVGPSAVSIYPGSEVTALFEAAYFASRQPGEGVFAINVNVPPKKIFAVAGEKNGITDFISDDARGLLNYGKPDMKLTQIYPI